LMVHASYETRDPAGVSPPDYLLRLDVAGTADDATKAAPHGD
jgi:hypothetical protein